MSREMHECRAWLAAYEAGAAPPLSTEEAVRFLRAQHGVIEAQASCVRQQGELIDRCLAALRQHEELFDRDPIVRTGIGSRLES